MVLADGCFDPIHIGHIRYLKAAQSLCIEDDDEPLVIRIATDDAIATKGRQPFQTADERARSVHLITDARAEVHASLAQYIAIAHPRLLVKGMDWYGKLPADVVAACERHGVGLVFVHTRERTSTERLA